MASRDYNDRYKEFRDAVIKRDKGKCQYPDCKRRSKIQIHHILRWVDSYEFRYEPSNGICLCRVCHKRITGKEYMYIELFQEIVRRNSAKRKPKRK